MNIGSAVKNTRILLKLRQNFVAKEIGITQTYLSQIESNGKKNPSIEIIEKLSAYYKVPLAIILWRALTDGDIKEDKRILFTQIKPIVDSLIDQLN